MKPTKVFLDSSVIIAGLAIPLPWRGGAKRRGGHCHKILALAELNLVTPFISEDVVSEVLRNIRKKLPESLDHFYMLFKTLPFKMADAAEQDLKYARTLINEKDAAILAAAMAGQVDWLLSLNKHFLTSDLQGRINFSIGSPKDFLDRYVIEK